MVSYPFTVTAYQAAETLFIRGADHKITQKNFALVVFYHMGSPGIYFNIKKMDPNSEKKVQECSVGGANGNFTPFC